MIELSETRLSFDCWELGVGGVEFFLKLSQHSQISVLEVKCVFWPVDWN